MKNILGFKTYGKTNFIKRIILEVKDRFRVNPLTKEILNEHGLKCYVPKLNRTRFVLGLMGVIFCIVTPIITPFLVIPLLWSIK